MRQITSALAAAALAATPFLAVSGQVLEVSTIAATFENNVPNSGTWINNADASNIKVCWPANSGTCPFGAGLSGYSFAPAGTPFNVNVDDPFSLGTFTHHNFVVDGTTLTSVDLDFSFTIDGVVGSFGDTWTLSHEETDNSTPCPPFSSGSICDDRVTFSISGSPTPFEHDGAQYILTLLGFGTYTDDEFIPNPEFITQEGVANETQLWAMITTPSETVPEPATMTLLATGLAGMAAARKRRKS